MSTNEPRHVITPSGHPKETVEWLEWRGYRAAVITPFREAKEFLPSLGGPFVSGYENVGKAGVMYGRKNEPLFLAQVGDVLVWDGFCVKVEE